MSAAAGRGREEQGGAGEPGAVRAGTIEESGRGKGAESAASERSGGVKTTRRSLASGDRHLSDISGADRVDAEPRSRRVAGGSGSARKE